MFGTVEGAGAGVPGVLAEEDREEGEEEAGDLEPQGGADMLEGLPEGLAEAASAFSHTARGLDEFFFGAGGGGVPGAAVGAACGVDAAALLAWAARSLTIREATRTPMPSLRPKRFGSMGKCIGLPSGAAAPAAHSGGFASLVAHVWARGRPR